MGSIMAANGMVWAAFLPIMIVMLSWLSYGIEGVIFIPLIWANAFSIPAWFIGSICTLPGIYALTASEGKRRNMALNVWVFMLLVFAIAIISAGIYWVLFFAENNEIASVCMKEARDELGKEVGKKVHENSLPTIKPGGGLDRAQDRAYQLGKAVAYYELYKALPYPFSALFFLHWQIGVTAVTFCVIPAILALWAFYHALGVRNYFATNPALYKNQRIIDGPLWDEEDSEAEGSEHSFDSDPESEEEEIPATKPLTKRHKEYSEPVDVIRVNPNANKVVQGGRAY